MDDDRVYFMASPLGGAYGAQWIGEHDIGLGLTAMAWKGPFYVSAALQDGQSNSNRNYPDLESFFDGQFLYVGELGMGRDPGGPDELSVRVTASHLSLKDGENPSAGPGQSLLVSLVKRHADQWAVAGRWSKSFKRLSGDYQELGSLALMWLEPFRRSRDLLGVGTFAGAPSDSSKGTETGIEIFYKFQLTQALRLVPDFQYWYRRDAGNATHAMIFGVRLGFGF